MSRLFDRVSLLAFAACIMPSIGGSTVSYKSVNADQNAAPASMSLVSRAYVPYDTNSAHLAYGMGAAEQIAYDSTEKYAYAVSEQGVVNVIDYNSPSSPQVTSYGIDLTAGGVSLTDVEVCGGHLFVAMAASTKTDAGMVKQYSTVKRASPATPVLSATHTVGPLPDMVKPNNACSKLAVANEAEGVYGTSLVDPAGSVSIIDIASGQVTSVPFTPVAASDDDLIAAGVHLPLPLKAMEYFDTVSVHFKDKIDFTAARAAYTPSTQLEPEYVVWSADDSKVYVNLQENSALITVNVDGDTATAASINSYGTKDWSSTGGTEGIDTVKDGACNLQHKPGFTSMRMPDSIASVEVDGAMYILTADEGDDKEYGDFEEKQKFKDLISSSTAFATEYAEFAEASSGVLQTAHTSFGGKKMRITIGSTAVDYSDPQQPKFKGAVGFGGRGISLYRADTMAKVSDSGSQFEKKQCETYPWAHNGIQDEEFADKYGVLYNMSTAGSKVREAIDELSDPAIDGCSNSGNGEPGPCPLGQTVDERSEKDGAGPESITVGVACQQLIAVTATEKQGTAFVWDISTITSPRLLFVHHLSPASETKSPEVAYANNELGDIDPESIVFLDASESPTGYAGVMFGGAWSGTISFYEFKDSSGSKCGVPPGYPQASFATSSLRLGLGALIALVSAVARAF